MASLATGNGRAEVEFENGSTRLRGENPRKSLWAASTPMARSRALPTATPGFRQNRSLTAKLSLRIGGVRIDRFRLVRWRFFTLLKRRLSLELWQPKLFEQFGRWLARPSVEMFLFLF
jgi:hypothetical protein